MDRYSIFREIFNSKEKGIELYNTIFGTDYKIETTSIEIINLESNLLSNKKSDIVFKMEQEFVVLVEYQTIIDKTIPLKMLVYTGKLLENILGIEATYKKKLVKIPTPNFIILYNGKEDLKVDNNVVNEMILKLSDTFLIPEESLSMKLDIKVIDIRLNKNHDVISHKSTLREYSIFRNEIQEQLTKGKDIDEIINYCIEHDILKEFLKKNSSKVKKALMQEKF